MKTVYVYVASLMLMASAAAESKYTLLQVCQDDLVVRTSDRADAGRISYIALDSTQGTVVSVLLSGGVLSERVIAVPYHTLRFDVAGRQATLMEIDEQRLVSAPVVERSFLTSATFDTKVIEQSRTHFETKADQPKR